MTFDGVWDLLGRSIAKILRVEEPDLAFGIICIWFRFFMIFFGPNWFVLATFHISFFFIRIVQGSGSTEEVQRLALLQYFAMEISRLFLLFSS